VPDQQQPSFGHLAGKLSISLRAALSGNAWGGGTMDFFQL